MAILQLGNAFCAGDRSVSAEIEFPQLSQPRQMHQPRVGDLLEKLGAKIKRNDNGDVSHIALYAIRPSERLKALPHLKALTTTT